MICLGTLNLLKDDMAPLSLVIGREAVKCDTAGAILGASVDHSPGNSRDGARATTVTMPAAGSGNRV